MSCCPQGMEQLGEPRAAADIGPDLRRAGRAAPALGPEPAESAGQRGGSINSPTRVALGQNSGFPSACLSLFFSPGFINSYGNRECV